MKKIILLIILILCTGCADYKELNSLSYVTAIGIDYQDEMFHVTYEIMDNKKEGTSIEASTYTVTGTGITNYEAQLEAMNKLDKTPYFAHTQVLILSDEAVNNQMIDIIDYIIRNPKLNEETLIVITEDATPKDIIETTSETNPAASIKITNLIQTNYYNESYSINLPFVIFAKDYVEDKIDPAVSIIEIKDEELYLGGINIFNNGKIVNTMDTSYSNLYSALYDNKSYILITNYKDNTIEAEAKFNHVNIDVTENNINMDIEVLVELKKSPDSLNLEDNESYEIITNNFINELNNTIDEFIKYLQKNKSDIFGFENIFYIQTRKDNDNLWETANININSNVIISRKGLIYNVLN